MSGCTARRRSDHRRVDRYALAAEDDAWVEFEPAEGKVLWAEFAGRFRFRSGVTADDSPAIVEPSPSVVWDLGSVVASDCPGGFAGGLP